MSIGNERSSAPESSTTNHHPGGMPQQLAQDGLKRRLGPSHLGAFGSVGGRKIARDVLHIGPFKGVLTIHLYVNDGHIFV